MLTHKFAITLLTLTVIATAPITAQVTGDRPMISGKVPLDGVEIHYEIHGEGSPLVLLHGGVLPSQTYDAQLAPLAQDHRVIAIHLRGHGHSTDNDKPWSAALMADDVAAVLRHLYIDRASVMGYSLGGAVALQLAFRHPELVEKLVIVSVPFRNDGHYPAGQQAFKDLVANAAAIGEQVAASPMAESYPGVNWESVFRKLGEMNQVEQDWSTDITKLTAPTLLVFADADATRPEHVVEFWKLLGGGQRDAGLDGSQRPVHQFAIIPGTTHYNLIQSPLLTQVAEAFLGQ
jgi:pimeloyl-ACP methyl ester carboxylesterase